MKGRALVLGVCIVGTARVAIPQDGSASTRLTVKEKDNAYELAVPVSRLVMTIPKGPLVLSRDHGGSRSPRYFYLMDRTNGLIVSGWFEPEESFRGIKEFWTSEQGAMKKQGLVPEDVAFEQIGKWSAIIYDLRVPAGRNSNIRAEWVEAGTWIDAHLSVTADLSRDAIRTRLRDCLATLQVAVKAK